ncbi:hypothetical protein IEQ34_022908 [Dendrobium chrysotoxum]|uniref:RNA polymerase Rpb4/RPC9 core domain-containing protein n=1 Tax=Dendrobium chrysotoxum TaxID=161865 RepID=A0AAV7G0D4_DENCH|nr:hypothetical protein IEQ34_022908 [Dendrobium chrysotoxum]
MAEKGGKGYSQPKGKTLKKSVATKPGKQSKDSPSLNKLNQIEIDSSDSEYEGFVDVKSPSPAKGDDKGSSDLKTGKVSFAGLKSSGKTSFEKSSDDWGKGGKGFSAGKGGGKGGLPQTKPVKSTVADKELKLEIELPPGAKVLMDCEAADILQGIQEHLDSLKDLKIKIPESFGNTLLYAKAAVHYTDAKSICMIANAGPETCEEAYGLIPTLKEKKDRIGDPLNVVLATLSKFKVNQEIPH